MWCGTSKSIWASCLSTGTDPRLYADMRRRSPSVCTAAQWALPRATQQLAARRAWKNAAPPCLKDENGSGLSPLMAAGVSLRKKEE